MRRREAKAVYNRNQIFIWYIAIIVTLLFLASIAEHAGWFH